MSYDPVVLPTIAPVAPPLGGAVPPPPPPPVAPAPLASFGADQQQLSGVASNTYYQGPPPGAFPGYAPYPGYGYPDPYAGPDVFDTMRDVTTGMANGIGRVGAEVGEALPGIGRGIWEGGTVVGRTVVDGGKKAAGFLPTIGRGLWGAVSWVGDKLGDAGRWMWGGADKVGDRLRWEYGQLPGGYPPGYPVMPGYPAPWPPAVIVERGDTLRGIAKQFLGDGERWKEIYALNEPLIRQAGGLRTGMVLRLPSPWAAGCPMCGPACRCARPTKPAPVPKPNPAPKPTPAPAPAPVPAPKPTPAEAPEAAPARSHTVRKGETLWGLAHRYYNDATRWREIFEANKAKIDNPHLIFPGQVFKIP